MRRTSQVSRFRAGLTVMAGLVALALSAPMAQAQDIPRGGELKCGNNLPGEFVWSVTATLVWTQGGAELTTVGQTFTCAPGAADSDLVLQPANPAGANADGWKLSISFTGTFGGNTGACTEEPSFTAGGVPHIRLRCVSPVGGAATFSLSRNP
jgi:hypothetical protein